MVLPDATAAFRPVEIVVLRDLGRHTFAYAGLGSTWDPPADDRDAMRAAVRRVGERLRASHGYRGAFGIDGVLTADGFRPTELNTRMSAGLTALAEVDKRFVTLLQAALLAGIDTRLTAADVEGLVALMDADRVGKVVAYGEGMSAGDEVSYPVTWDGTSFARSEAETGDRLAVGPTPSGFYARIDPCTAVVPGQRLAPACAALVRLLDAEHGTDFGPLEVAPDVRSAA